MCRILLFLVVMVSLPAEAQVRSLASVLAESASRSVTSDEAPLPAQTVEAALRQMHDAAATVFSGEVVAIRREGSAVAVHWKVDEAIRGVVAGQIFTAREWGGLWSDGPRYTVGQRSLVMLHAGSAAEYCAPVPDGVLPLRGDAVTGTVDLRWVMTHVQRAEQQPGGGVAGVQTLRGVLRSRALSMQKTVQRDDVEDDGRAVDRAMVTGMLRTWQMEREATLRGKQIGSGTR